MTDRPAHRRLVFGDDGSPGADVAWLWVLCHPWPAWRIEVATATEPPLGPPPAHASAVLHPWQPGSPRRLPAEAAASVEHLTAVADPRLALLVDADLLVIGAQGAGLLKALHLGSTAEWLVHDPPCPLALVRHGRPTQRVIVGADGSSHAARAVAALAALPWIAGREVLVVTAQDGRVDVDAAARAAAEPLRAAGAQVRALRSEGRPTPVLLAEIERSTPDLVVLGTRGLSAWQRLRLGSTTNAVLRGTTCSLLVAAGVED